MLVSIQQAACNALAKYLLDNIGTDVSVMSRWPSPSQSLPDKAITIVQSGARTDLPIDPQILRFSSVNADRVNATYQIAACEIPIQLDVWTKKDVYRDDLVARLDNVLNDYFGREPANGVALKLRDGWEDTYADFWFEFCGDQDTPDAAMRGEYRAIYRGTATFMLTVTRETAKQKVINLRLSLNGESAPHVVEIP
jgi:hypothetical protein